MNNKKEIGNRIRELRKSKNISQQELGKVLDKSHAAISDIELGKTELSVSDLTSISSFLGVSVSSLIDEAGTNAIPDYSFSHFRSSKDTSPEEMQEIDKASDAFDAEMKKRSEEGKL